jgi:predicted TIM-barrel fold metal-dependent hydrolase
LRRFPAFLAQGRLVCRVASRGPACFIPFGVSYGIPNPLFGVQMVFSEDMADAFCRALNDWLVKEWLDKDSRLRGSIVIPVQTGCRSDDVRSTG